MDDLKTFSYGSCRIAAYNPKREEWTPKTKIVNIKIKFEEALMLSLALDECVRKLNKYKRSTTTGKRAAVNLVLNLAYNKLSVAETKI